MKKTLIIIPAFNEEKNIESVIKELKENANFADILVVNDCSTDKTSVICKKHRVRVIDLLFNLGIGGAVQTGYQYAYENGYDIAVQLDGDGQHDSKHIKDLIKPIEEDKANMVVGSRFIDKTADGFKSTASRRFGIKIISSIIKFKVHEKYYDVTSGFRAVDKKALKLFAENYPAEYPEPISIVSATNSRLKIQEIPVTMRSRKGGKSSIHSWKNIYYMFYVIVIIILIEKGVKNYE